MSPKWGQKGYNFVLFDFIFLFIPKHATIEFQYLPFNTHNWCWKFYSSICARTLRYFPDTFETLTPPFDLEIDSMVYFLFYSSTLCRLCWSKRAMYDKSITALENNWTPANGVNHLRKGVHFIIELHKGRTNGENGWISHIFFLYASWLFRVKQSLFCAMNCVQETYPRTSRWRPQEWYYLWCCSFIFFLLLETFWKIF